MTTADDNQDPIGAASSGLRALGVTPRRRIETLGLLAALLDLADERGEVLLDAALMETEERLGFDACLEGYEWLERLDVIRRTWSGWVIHNFGEHHGPAGMTEAALAVLQRHLESTHDAPIVAPAVKSWRRRVPVLAASVAAGVAVIAGATQFVPQAAVTTRNAAVDRGDSTAVQAGLPTTAATTAASAPSTITAPSVTNEPVAAPVFGAATTSTSSTIVPALPCVGDVLRDLGSRTGLRTTQTTQTAPGVLPCP